MTTVHSAHLSSSSLYLSNGNLTQMKNMVGKKKVLKSDFEGEPDKHAKQHILSLPVGMFIRSNKKGLQHFQTHFTRPPLL